MLPGFRFLFAAIMLSMSLLIFGLGAAALLRAAHESFASNSSWRAAPEATFAQHPEPAMPVLAALRVEPVAEKAVEPAKVVAAPVEPMPSPAESAGRDQAVSSSFSETTAIGAIAPDIAPAQMATAENPLAPEVGPTAEAAASDKATMAAVAASAVSSDSSRLAMPEPEPAVLPPTKATTSEANVASTKIATLGGPPVEIAADIPVHAKDDQKAVQKRAETRRTAHRRRLVSRAWLAAQQLQLQQGNPFAQTGPIATRHGH
jgi:hypothetical protein